MKCNKTRISYHSYPNHSNVILAGERTVQRMREQRQHRAGRRARIGRRNCSGPHERLGGRHQLVVVVQDATGRRQHVVRMDDGAAAEATARQVDGHLRRVLAERRGGAAVQRVHNAGAQHQNYSWARKRMMLFDMDMHFYNYCHLRQLSMASRNTFIFGWRYVVIC